MRSALILGGARSGKSRHAERLVEAMAPPWIYVATAQAFDAEMAERIEIHKARRKAPWRTIEAPLEVAAALEESAGPVLVDCLTLWLTNLMLANIDIAPEVEALASALEKARHPVVLVSNEVGLGIVPDNELARAFRDEQGRLNQAIAARADRVVLMVAGIAMVVK